MGGSNSSLSWTEKGVDTAILCQDGFAHEQQWLAVKAEWRRNFNKLHQEYNTIVVRFTTLNIPVGGSNSSNSWTEKGQSGHFVSRWLCPWTTVVSCQSQIKKLIANYIRNIVFRFTNLDIPVGGSNSSLSWTEKGVIWPFCVKTALPMNNNGSLSKPNEETYHKLYQEYSFHIY